MEPDQVRPPLTSFRDRHLDDQLWDHGFVIVDLMDADEVVELRDRWAAGGASTEPFRTTALHHPADPGPRAWHEHLRQRFQPRIDALLVDHEIRHGFFMEKAPVDPRVDHGTVPLHQDWTFVDETGSRGLIIWCPLVDVGADAGPLQVVPGSHRLTDAPRGAGGVPWALAPLDEVLRSALVTLEVPAGRAVVYDGALVHASPPNHAAVPRPVVGLGTTHRSARLVTFHAEPDGRVRCFDVDADHFIETDLEHAPTRHHGVVEVDAAPLAPAELHRIEQQVRSRTSHSGPIRPTA